MRRLFCALFAALAVGFTPQGLADTWPSKPVRMLGGFPPGGPVDVLARALAPSLQEILGQPFVIENRPGAAGTVAAGEAARAAPDGYTLLLAPGSTIVTGRLMYPKLAYDPMTALVPVAPVGLASLFLQTRPDLPAGTLAEFIAYARANPGKLNFGSPGVGSSPHLAGVMLNRAVNIETVHVPYKGAAAATTDLVGGRIDFMFDPGVGLPHVKAGKLRLLAIGSSRRHPDYPDTPTVTELLGIEFDTDTTFGIYVPAGTPKEIVARLHRLISRQMEAGPLGERAVKVLGYQRIVLTPEEFAARLKADHERLSKLWREAGLQVE